MKTTAYTDLDKYYQDVRRIGGIVKFALGRETQKSFRLQGWGVAIILQEDGTWHFEDTSGG